MFSEWQLLLYTRCACQCPYYISMAACLEYFYGNKIYEWMWQKKIDITRRLRAFSYRQSFRWLSNWNGQTRVNKKITRWLWQIHLSIKVLNRVLLTFRKVKVCCLRKLQISIHHSNDKNAVISLHCIPMNPMQGKWLMCMIDSKNVLRPYRHSKFYFPKGSFAFSV